uniref:Uncharacterized protein n=1 Tax=Chromera velia CCMP2878 TaxID=1169474 RepID=A0A0G4HHT9_9ALVE|eukprot:Cvel_1052.t1-p1 / transcript=Cvel_1052.t1 / gene=Cvel_1052 / organism=Chromera_velia_CCMP2878 / gene_product=hypothetical protein / transcript_product=hypothetical protein / location=Cvel_scaffold34:74264-74752(-) / protein_length=163 / sequence_SO=supercontig / SO=protein_coding / is_pseudo=false
MVSGSMKNLLRLTLLFTVTASLFFRASGFFLLKSSDRRLGPGQAAVRRNQKPPGVSRLCVEWRETPGKTVRTGDSVKVLTKDVTIGPSGTSSFGLVGTVVRVVGEEDDGKEPECRGSHIGWDAPFVVEFVLPFRDDDQGVGGEGKKVTGYFAEDEIVRVEPQD